MNLGWGIFFSRSLVASALVVSYIAHSSAVASDWRFKTSNDEMTGEIRAFAFGPSAAPTKPLEFPYRNIRSWMGFGCDRKGEWAYVGFSESPNITNTRPKSGGYSLMQNRIRWDDSVEKVKMSQRFGARFLHFENDAKAISNMNNASSVLLELAWYRSGNTYFKYSLKGSASAIEKAREACRK